METKKLFICIAAFMIIFFVMTGIILPYLVSSTLPLIAIVGLSVALPSFILYWIIAGVKRIKFKSIKKGKK